MSRIRPLRPGESSDPEANRLLDEGKSSWWQDPAMFGVIAHNPELLKAIVPTFEAFFAKGHVEPHIFEMMRLVTGKANDCAYWQTVRTAAVRSVVTEKEAAFLGEGIDESRLTPKEALAVRLADKIARDPHEVTTPFFNRLREHFTDQEIVELVFACGIFNWGNKFNITMQMDTDSASDYAHRLAYREVEA